VASGILDRTYISRPGVREAEAKLQDLNLSMLRMKLSDPVEGKGWSLEQLDLAEQEYRRFLVLNLLFPDESIVPSKMVDEVWHAHVLDTQAYASDTVRIFGSFFHHFPYFGMRGDADLIEFSAAARRTKELYQQIFGNPPAGTWDSSANCERKNCKPQRCKSAN